MYRIPHKLNSSHNVVSNLNFKENKHLPYVESLTLRTQRLYKGTPFQMLDITSLLENI